MRRGIPEKKTPSVFSHLTSGNEKLKNLNLKVSETQKEEIEALVKKLKKEGGPVKVTQVQLMMTGFKLLQKELKKTPYIKVLAKLE